jgi:signal transduction histidine kinase
VPFLGAMCNTLSMARPTWTRTSLTSSLFIALAAFGLSALVLGFIEVALLWLRADATLDLTVVVLVGSGWVFVFAGLLAWGRRPNNRLGAIMAFAGLTVLLTLLSSIPNTGLVVLGTIVASLPLAVVVHLLLAFPTGTLRSPLARGTVIAVYAVSLVLQVPLYLLGPPGSPMAVAQRPDLLTAAKWTQRGAGWLVIMVTIYILARRWRDSGHRARRVLGSLYLYGVFAVLFVPISADALAPAFDWNPLWLYMAQAAELGVVPVLFTIAVLRGGFGRTGEVQELASWLAADAARRPMLVQGLATTLGDPSVELAYWAADREEYVDGSGSPARLPIGDETRAVHEIRVHSRLVGALIYDTTLNPEPEDVAAVGRVVALAVDRDRLTAELGASREALRRSRTRIVEAGHRERRQVALALHDGLQGRLVMLSLRAGRIASAAEVSDATEAEAAKLCRELDEAARELRDVVHRIMPAALIERGLAAALEDLVDRTPVPTSLSVTLTDRRLPRDVEGLAYFVVAEALTNTLKHSRANQIAVAVVVDSENIHVTVDDNGVGGAQISHGMGLRAMRDRVDALDGWLRLEEGPDGGTRLVALLPLLERDPLLTS